jgi:hypothetical protein
MYIAALPAAVELFGAGEFAGESLNPIWSVWEPLLTLGRFEPGAI